MDEISKLVLGKMIEDDNKSSGNVRLQKELTDLETLFVQRQDRLWRALKEGYQYDTSVKHSQDFLLTRKPQDVTRYHVRRSSWFDSIVFFCHTVCAFSCLIMCFPYLLRIHNSCQSPQLLRLVWLTVAPGKIILNMFFC